ncbi:hypothetical protein ANN_16106 [Periplaneta americana]|uniref:Uncharacterized protein n=1 Tax=Periplaneta americana TaxID=6978 RepID=A0ABQ8SI23_PERAM|nr:hypothetical protein ANN_16106 [Periplaneta americana]
MAGLCEGGNEPPGSLKTSNRESITRPTEDGARVEETSRERRGARRERSAAKLTGGDGRKGNDGKLGRSREGEIKQLRLRGEIQRSFEKRHPLGICRLFAKS